MSGPPWRFKGIGGKSQAIHEAHYMETERSLKEMSKEVAEKHAEVAVSVLDRFKNFIRSPHDR